MSEKKGNLPSPEEALNSLVRRYIRDQTGIIPNEECLDPDLEAKLEAIENSAAKLIVEALQTPPAKLDQLEEKVRIMGERVWPDIINS